MLLFQSEVFQFNMTIQTIKKQITPILRSQGVVKAALFGSTARGKMKKNSDIDILIQYDPKLKKSLLDLVRLQYKLEEKLGRKVDLLTYKGINHLLKDIILSEQKIIYEKKS